MTSWSPQGTWGTVVRLGLSVVVVLVLVLASAAAARSLLSQQRCL